ncbi:transglutaminase-like domain-containing protein [Psychroserpens algicola]|uniref:Transglutaminase-like domain-containing protein n=1 Tax=Psychroserpens algicola TaxID=1719034 RepID=A0ABT0H5C2_9FLAO|nr:transglutaminase-like domain-containing protein [Psychroserpens algicola]MCK8479546.1 transglutaminase-like domain-containing protein [Psychroserpens algicola]
MSFKKILWTFKRHPFLYLTRFRLLSKNSNVSEIEDFTYNYVNDKADIPEYFHQVNTSVFSDGKPDTDLEVVKKLSNWLANNIKGGPGLSVPSDEALKIMLEGKGGVCSDIVQVFNNFCVINGIKVREWGVTRAPFNKEYGGHSFNEVFCEELNKWVLIDVSYCTLFYYEDETTPLSVIELYQLLREHKNVHYKSFNEAKTPDKESVDKNYLNPDTIPFLICNYSNKTYDSFLKYSRPLVPIFMIHFVLFTISKSYYYKFPLDDYKKIFS